MSNRNRGLCVLLVVLACIFIPLARAQLCSVGRSSGTGSAPCTNCTTGRYAATTGLTQCTACAAGKYSATTGATSSTTCINCDAGQSSAAASSTCTNCVAGRYAVAPGTGSCTSCAAGKASAQIGATSATVCETCGLGTYSTSANSFCSACVRGRYGTGTGLTASTACANCAVGKFSIAFAATNSSVCQNCTTGRYQASSTGVSTCSICIQGTYSGVIAATSASACIACPAGKRGIAQSATSASACEDCGVGRYNALSTGVSVCTQCLAGRSSDVTGATTATVCVLCDYGKYSAAGASFCTACIRGRYGSTQGLTATTACTNCAAGQFSIEFAAHNSSVCQNCTAGRYQTSATGVSTCTSCAAGKYSGVVAATTAGTCQPCSAGKYGATAAATSSSICTDCLAGRYNALTTGVQSCTACVAGTANSLTGSNSSDACITCPGGKYSTATARTICTVCAVGKYSGTLGATTASTCISCLAGQFSTAIAALNQTVCRPCAPGAYQTLATGVSVCTLCARGSYSNATGATSATTCVLCPAGKYGLVAGLTSADVCTACEAGTYNANLGSTSSVACTDCLRGSFGTAIAATNSSVCHLCAAGSYTSATGLTFCTLCAVGRYNPLIGATTSSSCLSCPIGTASNVVGLANICMNCTIGNYASLTARTSCTICPTGRYNTGQGQTACVQCSLGTFNNHTGSTSPDACVLCPIGRQGPTTGRSACACCAASRYGVVAGATSVAQGCPACYQGSWSSATCAVGIESCTNCTVGTFGSDSPGNAGPSICFNCTMGRYSQSSGQSVCDGCGAGYYNPDVSSTSANACLECPAGTASADPASGSRGNCYNCTTGTYSDLAASSVCTNCTAGRFNFRNGSSVSTDCEMCPFGTNSANAGQSSCQACQTGFTGNGFGNCTDVNECLVNNGGCSRAPVVLCTNTVGSRVCATCPSGYSGNGIGNCTDVNECLNDNGGCISGLQQCVNTHGSYSCPCLAGRGGAPNCCPLLPAYQGQPSNQWPVCGGRGTCPNLDGHCVWHTSLADGYGCPITSTQSSSCGIYGSCEQYGNCTCGLGVYYNISGSACQRNANCDYAGVTNCNGAGTCHSVATNFGCMLQLHLHAQHNHTMVVSGVPLGYVFDGGLAALLMRLYNGFVTFNPRQTDQPFATFAQYNATYAAGFRLCLLEFERRVCLGRVLIAFANSNINYQSAPMARTLDAAAALYPGRIGVSPSVAQRAALMYSLGPTVIATLPGIGPITGNLRATTSLLCYEATILNLFDASQNLVPTASVPVTATAADSFVCVCAETAVGATIGVGGPQCRYTCPVGSNGHVCSGLHNGILHGACASEGQCLCDLHFAGPACNTDLIGMCYDAYNNSRTCSFDKTGASCGLVSPGVYACDCPAKWTGSYCQYEACALPGASEEQKRIECHERGECNGVTEWCECDGIPYGGPLVLNTTLPYPEFYTGQDCQLPAFDQCSWFVVANASTLCGHWTRCNDNGDCLSNSTYPTPHCSCQHPYYGERCQLAVCSPVCNSHQSCDDDGVETSVPGSCFCRPRWRTPSTGCAPGNRACECSVHTCGYGIPSANGVNCLCDATWKKDVNGSCTVPICPLLYLGSPLLGITTCPPGKPTCTEQQILTGGDCCSDLCDQCTFNATSNTRSCACAAIPALILASPFCANNSCAGIEVGYYNVNGFCVPRCGGGRPVVSVNGTFAGCDCDPNPAASMNLQTQFYRSTDCRVTTCLNGGRANQTTEACDCTAIFNQPTCALSACGDQGIANAATQVCDCIAPYTFTTTTGGSGGNRTSPFCTSHTCGANGAVVESTQTMTLLECRCSGTSTVLSNDRHRCELIDCIGNLEHAAKCAQCRIGIDSVPYVDHHAIHCKAGWGDVAACPLPGNFTGGVGVGTEFDLSDDCQVCNGTLHFHQLNPDIYEVGLPLHVGTDHGSCARPANPVPWCAAGWWKFTANTADTVAQACTVPRRSTWCSNRGNTTVPTLYNDVGVVCLCDAGFSGARDLVTPARSQGCWARIRTDLCGGHGDSTLGASHQHMANDVIACACDVGWTGASCSTDINECLTANGGCDPLSACTNTAGNRTCGQCPSGYSGDGFSGCTDVNECLDGDNGGCDPFSVCTNTAGSRTCGPCPSGFTGNGDSVCIDINECLVGHGGCDSLVSCTNTPGSRTCGMCPSGYNTTYPVSPTAVVCIDINECTTRHQTCSGNGTCTNAPPGGFTCTCGIGHYPSGTALAVSLSAPMPVFCNRSASPCLIHPPCQNNGICTAYHDNTGFVCACINGFTGTLCQTLVGPPNAGGCLLNLCLNGAACVDDIDGSTFRCICKSPWFGTRCGSFNATKSCAFSGDGGCANNGQCAASDAQTELASLQSNTTNGIDFGDTTWSLSASYKCDCSDQWTGKKCLTLATDCTWVSCTNENDICQDLDGTINGIFNCTVSANDGGGDGGGNNLQPFSSSSSSYAIRSLRAANEFEDAPISMDYEQDWPAGADPSDNPSCTVANVVGPNREMHHCKLGADLVINFAMRTRLLVDRQMTSANRSLVFMNGIRILCGSGQSIGRIHTRDIRFTSDSVISRQCTWIVRLALIRANDTAANMITRASPAFLTMNPDRDLVQTWTGATLPWILTPYKYGNGHVFFISSPKDARVNGGRAWILFDDGANQLSRLGLDGDTSSPSSLGVLEFSTDESVLPQSQSAIHDKSLWTMVPRDFLHLYVQCVDHSGSDVWTRGSCV